MTQSIPLNLTIWLCDVLATLARLPEPPAPEINATTLGISSLAMVTLQYRLMTERGISAPLEDLIAPRSIAALAAHLTTLLETEDAA